jgi:HSP20 family protein
VQETKNDAKTARTQTVIPSQVSEDMLLVCVLLFQAPVKADHGSIKGDHLMRSLIMSLPTRVQRQTGDGTDLAEREFNSLLNRFFGSRETGGGGYLAPYAVDVREDNDHVYVEAELPGFKKDEVDVTLENQTLTISAERREGGTNEPQKGEHLLRERRYTRFLRSFTLPPTVDEQTVNAKLTDGVLTVTLNKREETKPRKIAVA